MKCFSNTRLSAKAACVSTLLVVAVTSPCPAQSSTFPGMGSIPYDRGTTFRVWAPNATNVTVAGDFNSFSTTANPLFSEGTNGNWSVDVRGASPGNQYKYYINRTTYKQDPRCRQQVSSVGNCLIYNTNNFNWAGDNFTAPSLGDAVIYEMHCATFEDPTPTSESHGTFYTATNGLPFLQQLGVNVIEVMPISEFPGNYSWGYNPSDIFGVESSYGGPDEFKTFVKTAHQYGIAVLLDVVHNHYGPTDLDLWQFDGSYVSSGGTNYWGIYFYQNNCQANTPYGLTRPDYGTPQVATFIQDNFTMWLNECHVDGFRWDSPGYMVNDNCGNFNTAAASLIEQASSMIHTAYTGKINIGEDQNEFSGTAGFDATWDGNTFYNNIEPQLANSSDSARNMGSISYAVNINHNGGGLGGWGTVVFLESHDLCGDLNNGQRLPYYIDNNNPASYFARKRATLGTAITLTTAGIPMLLGGEEMFTTNQFAVNDPTAGHEFNPINWSLTNTYSGIVSLYTDLISLRRNLNGLSSGLQGVNTSTIWQDNTSKLIAYRRWNTGSMGDDVIVICNFANTNWPAYNVGGFPHTGVWYAQFNSDSTKYGSDYGNFGSLSTTVAVSTATISIAPYSVLVLSQNVPGLLPTPQNLNATITGPNQISLVWNSVGSATGYIVKRGGSQIATTTATNYSDAGLVTGTMYCYTVAATNVVSVSADSPQACATAGPPPPPQNLNATAASTNQINLVWNTSTAATGYIVKRGGSQIATTTATNYSDVSLVADTMYCYSVDATNAGGVSADSTQACALTAPLSTSATNLLAYWTFDEGTGTTAYDSSGNANTGTVVNATWTSGMIHGALAFNGAMAQVTVPYSASLNPVSTITIAAWINAVNWSNTPRILEKGNDDQYGLFLNGSGQLEFFLAGVTNGILLATPPSAGTWHHVAGTYDGSLISLYIDGQLAAQQSASGPLTITPEMLAIGANPSGGPSNFFDGIIDDVRIYGSAQPAGQISQLYSTDSVGDGIPNWWRQQYFGISSTTTPASCATCDADGTGQNNLTKFLAGLNPTNPASMFRIVSLAPEGQNLLATWTTVGGHSNALQSTLGTVVGSYSNLFTDISPVIVVPGTSATTTNFLIVGAVPKLGPLPAGQGPTNLANSGTSSVEISAADTRGLADAAGAVPIGSVLMMGTFGISDSIIQSDFSAGAISAIMSAFTPYGASFACGDGVGCAAFFDVQTNAVGFGGLQIYLVAFDQPTIAAATQMGIFTSPSWVFPNNAIASVDIETATDFVVGTNGGSLTVHCGNANYVFSDTAQLAIIPATTRFYRVRLAP